MDSPIPAVKRKAYRTGLTMKRKNMIKSFFKRGTDRPGTKLWCFNLHNYMSHMDPRVTLSDVERWVDKHSWITEDCDAFMTDDNETNDSQQEFFLPQLSPQPLPSIPKLSRHSGSLTNLSEPNLRREHKPTQSSLHIEGSSRQRPGLPLTPSSATSSVSQTITPVEGACNHTDSRISTPTSVCVEPPQFSNETGHFSTVPDISEEQLKKEYFSSAFNAISVLHEICSQMPEVRVCLRPLKDIHRCFVRTHEKFIFPEEYSTVRGAAGAQLSTIKIDPATLNQEEVVAFEEDTIEICNT